MNDESLTDAELSEKLSRQASEDLKRNGRGVSSPAELLKASNDIKVTFVNPLADKCGIFWLNNEQKEIEIGVVHENGGTFVINSFHTHTFVLRERTSSTKVRAVTLSKENGIAQTIDIQTGAVKGDPIKNDEVETDQQFSVKTSEIITQEYKAIQQLRKSWYADTAKSVDWKSARPDTGGGTRAAADDAWCGGAAEGWLGKASVKRAGDDSVLPAGAVPGYHVICISRDAEADTKYRIEAARFGKHGVPLFVQKVKETAEAKIDPSLRWSAWRAKIEHVTQLFKRDNLLVPGAYTTRDVRGAQFNESWLPDEIAGLRSGPSKGGASATWPDRWIPQKWKMFNVDGEHVESTEKMLSMVDGPAQTLFLIFEGGQFVWPGIEIGYQRKNVEVEEGKFVTITTESIQPLVLTFDSFLSPRECKKVIADAEPHMASSGLTMTDKDIALGSAADKFRTSTTHWLRSDLRKRPWLEAVDLRVANITRSTWGVRSQEAVQVLRYNEGQFYDAHLDWTDRQYYSRSKANMLSKHGGYKNRLVTVFWYLSDVADGDGGETHFPRAGGLRMPRSNHGCADKTGLKVQPRLGRGMMFYNLLPDGVGDVYSLHTACPLKHSAKKWAANKWVLNEPFKSLGGTEK